MLVVSFDKVAVTGREESSVTSLVACIRGVDKEAAWFLMGEAAPDNNDGVVDTMFTEEDETTVTALLDDTGVDTSTSGEDCICIFGNSTALGSGDLTSGFSFSRLPSSPVTT